MKTALTRMLLFILFTGCGVLKADWSEAAPVDMAASLVLDCPGKGHWITLVRTK